ncbi:hypothetical protein [Flavobacterium sp. CAU 1735]|uniref:hypothetical protein n=1 Tax=Flavobacterium sp. CAU 1735 TaxID=3140361 RepID=UPI0032613B35
MINKAQQEKIKSVLGSKYSPAIIKRLNRRKVVNARGGSYSPESIQKIVKGKIENPAVELEIAKLVSDTIAKQKKIEAQKKALLK